MSKAFLHSPRAYHDLNMPNSVIYDDAVYHQGAPAFTTGRLKPQSAGTHIGMYLAWIILNRMESFHLRQIAAVPVEEVRNKQLTGRDFLFAHCEGQLTSDALNNEAQSFTASYYEDQYLHDYDAILVAKATGTYTVADTWSNFERLSKVMDQRLRDFRGNNTPSSRPASAAG
jgi:hypothetical protein